MKNQLKYIILCLITVSFYSCNGEDDVLSEYGANANLVDSEITVLDQDETLTIDLFTNNTEFESIEIQDSEGNVLGNATITDRQANFNSSILGDLSAGESISLWIVSTLSNGEIRRQPASIDVTSAVSVSAPASISYMDPEEALLEYSLSTLSASIDSFNLQWRANDEETWNDSDIELSPEGGEINLAELNLEDYGVEAGDDLHFRLTAESGEFSDEAEASVSIVTQSFGTTSSGNISSDPTMSQFSFTSGQNYESDSEEGEIQFISPAGFEVINGTNMDFVEVTEDGFFNNADLFDAEEAYEAGTPVSSVSEIENGDVFVYRYVRTVENEDGAMVNASYYGIFRIGSVTTTTVDGEETVSFEMEYSEGTILR